MYKALKNRFQGLLNQMTMIMGAQGAEAIEQMITRLETLKGLIDQVIYTNFYHSILKNINHINYKKKILGPQSNKRSRENNICLCLYS
jgi:hypothetical protein